MKQLRAPFPWFGGKSRASSLIWDRLGDVDTYNEPFAGSLAVLLGRPHEPRVETVNDLDAFLANFWRALQAEPEQVAYWADYPVNETDLHARHRWLVSRTEFRQQMKTDPDFYDAKIAGWWVWGQCLWIGSGWCANPEWTGRGVGAAANRGVHSQQMSTDARRRWQGGGQGGGSGVHAPRLTQQKPLLRGDSGASGSGVHARRLSQQMPRISAEGGSISGVTATPLVESGGLYDYLAELARRLRRVRVCCGDWKRVLTPSVTTYIGTCGTVLDPGAVLSGWFLDPPYAHALRERCYSEDHDISADVRAWAIENGDNPNLRIALCGYEDEHKDHMPATWAMEKWKAHGGYSRTERGKANRERERIWFSPHCLQPANGLPFEGAA